MLFAIPVKFQFFSKLKKKKAHLLDVVFIHKKKVAFPGLQFAFIPGILLWLRA